MDQGDDRRPYHSPLRNRRARNTRRAILASAQRLFSEKGYGATTMRDIAEDAGVAVQTIYASIGSKRDILSAFIDQIEDDADITEAGTWFLEADDPAEHLRLRAMLSRRIFGTGIKLIEVLISSQGTGSDVRQVIEEGDARHRRSVQEWIVDRWGDDVLRDGLTKTEAIDIISTMSGVDTYRWLIRRYGWSPDRYETWLYQSLVELVLSGKYRT